MQTREQPLVSIVIPVYNGANYMREAIESALAQTYENIEVIVVNDGSRDDGATAAIAKSYGDRIHYVEKPNGGVSSALNAGIRAMRGKYFSWLSHDDFYLPDKIRTQVEVLEGLGRDDVVGICEARTVNSASQEIPSSVIGKDLWAKKQVGEVISWEEALCDVIERGSYNGCAFLIPRAAFDKTGPFDEELRYSQDLLMWMRLFLSGYGVVRTPGAHVCNRVHPGQLTQTGKELFHSNCEIMCRKILPQLCEKSNREHNALLCYGLYNAKYDNGEAVQQIIVAGRRARLLTARDCASIRATLAYGRVRPLIRKLYYRVFRRMKTA